MEFDWDDDKATSNLAKHGVSFELVYEMDWASLLVRPDDRFEYREMRWRALDASRRLVVVFTRRGDKYRIISLRRAHEKEIRRWAAHR